MFLGILAGLFAGAFWGFSFLVPKVLSGYSSGEVALGRFGYYAAISAILLLLRIKKIKFLFHRPFLTKAILLSLTGNTFYYFLLIYSIRFAGIPYATLCIGMVPVTSVLFSGEKNIKKFAFPLSLIVTGMVLISYYLFCQSSVKEVTLLQKGIGFLFGPLALISWTWYAIENAKFVKKYPEVSLVLWTNFLGLITFLTMVPVYLIESYLSGSRSLLFHSSQAELTHFLIWTAVIGLGASWLATLLWNKASQALPTSLTGQLIVSETVFSLWYGFIYESRFPSLLESISIVLIIAGVFLSLRNFRKASLSV